jgi:hypothetical protein
VFTSLLGGDDGEDLLGTMKLFADPFIPLSPVAPIAQLILLVVIWSNHPSEGWPFGKSISLAQWVETTVFMKFLENLPSLAIGHESGEDLP